MHAVILFRATNDRNGNPCRCFAAFDQFGQLVGAWDEGYSGHHAVPPELRNAAAVCHAVSVSQATYRSILKQGQQAARMSPGRFSA
jgi:hypothetical protein